MPINVDESDTGGDNPGGFDLDAYNQSNFFSPTSITSFELTGGGGETYHAHVEGNISDDQGDSFGFLMDDGGDDGFDEDDGGTDTARSGGFDTHDTFNDGDHGNETDTFRITGTLAGGLSVTFRDTITSAYHHHDQGYDNELGGAESGLDNFDDGDSGNDTPDLTKKMVSVHLFLPSRRPRHRLAPCRACRVPSLMGWSTTL